MPSAEPLRNFLVWVLSEAIGALALVPLGLLFKPHYLLRHRNPKLLLETLVTLVVTLVLCWTAITSAAVAIHLHHRSADVERGTSAAYGSVPDIFIHHHDGVPDDGAKSALHDALLHDRHLQRAVAPLPDDAAPRQYYDDGDVCLPGRA